MKKIEQADNEDLVRAGDTVQWLSDQADALLPADVDRAQMTAVLRLARSYLLEFAVHRSRGRSELEAMASTAKGELDVTAQMDTYRMSLN